MPGFVWWREKPVVMSRARKYPVELLERATRLLSNDEREEIRKLRREVSELRRANEILKAASVFFAGELDPHRPR